MSDEVIFSKRITVKPSSLEFWPATGWYRTDRGFAKLFKCQDVHIIRRATVEHVAARWTFAVREYTKNHGCLLVASVRLGTEVCQPTICWHAADLAACNKNHNERIAQ